MSQSQVSELETLIRARYPIIYVATWEEKRVENALRLVARDRGKQVHCWTVTQGFAVAGGPRDGASRDPLAAMEYILKAPEQSIFVMKDFHPFISEASVTRRLRDLTLTLKTSYKTLVLISPMVKLPAELEKEVTIVDFGLPAYDDLSELLGNIIRQVRDVPDVVVDLAPEDRERVLKAAQGLTAMEAENVFAKSLIRTRTFDVDVILSEKEQIIRKSGILEYYPCNEAFADVGGLDLLKQWMDRRTRSFTDKARAFGLPEPRGILLLGVQGCGKSLSAKAIGAQWRLPLLRLDIGKIFAGLVGASEENMRKAIRVAESVAPCVLWLDELEKGLSGTQGSGDGGTTSRVFGTFLTWLQEKTVPVFVVSTANQVQNLPPELLRKGRFDEIFFIDLPSQPERKEIFEIHLRKRKRDVSTFDTGLLAMMTPGFSGAEIEQAVIEALYTAFDQGSELATGHIKEAIQATVPLSMTMREKIAELREWAADRARPASTEKAEPFEVQEAVFTRIRQAAAVERAATPVPAAPAAEPPARAATKPKRVRRPRPQEPAN